MTLEERIYLAAMTAVLVLILAGAIWFIPQKWHACQKLYDNLLAQVLCVTSK